MHTIHLPSECWDRAGSERKSAHHTPHAAHCTRCALHNVHSASVAVHGGGPCTEKRREAARAVGGYRGESGTPCPGKSESTTSDATKPVPLLKHEQTQMTRGWRKLIMGRRTHPLRERCSGRLPHPPSPVSKGRLVQAASGQGDLKIALRGGGGGLEKWGSVSGPLFCVRTDVGAKGAGTQNFGPKKFFPPIIPPPPPHLSSQNDQRDVSIILSHRCWVDPPPRHGRSGTPALNPPSRHRGQGGGGGLGKWASVSPPPPQSNFLPAQLPNPPSLCPRAAGPLGRSVRCRGRGRSDRQRGAAWHARLRVYRGCLHVPFGVGGEGGGDMRVRGSTRPPLRHQRSARQPHRRDGIERFCGVCWCGHRPRMGFDGAPTAVRAEGSRSFKHSTSGGLPTVVDPDSNPGSGARRLRGMTTEPLVARQALNGWGLRGPHLWVRTRPIQGPRPESEAGPMTTELRHSAGELADR